MNFAACARRWLPLAAQMLGWNPDEFWRATPEDLAAALSDPAPHASPPPDRELISRMMERDAHG